jgi:hypothetical protein
MQTQVIPWSEMDAFPRLRGHVRADSELLCRDRMRCARRRDSLDWLNIRVNALKSFVKPNHIIRRTLWRQTSRSGTMLARVP